MKIGIVIPFYNEKENLIFFIKEWERFLTNKKNIRKNLFFFFFDDGSNDLSSKAISKNIKKIKHRIIKKKNSGHGDTCRYGYKYIIKKFKKFEYILQIDSDNQCDPKYLTKFINLAKQKNDFILGYRNKREDGFLRLLTSKIMSLIFFLKKKNYVKDLNTPYRMMRIEPLKEIVAKIEKKKKYKQVQLYNCLLSYQMIKYYKISWIKIIFRERYYGNSKFNFKKMLSMFLNFIIKV